MPVCIVSHVEPCLSLCSEEDGLRLNEYTLEKWDIGDDGRVCLYGFDLYITSELALAPSSEAAIFRLEKRDFGIVSLLLDGRYVGYNAETKRFCFVEKKMEWILIDPTTRDDYENHHVVVARYQENVAWTRFLPFRVFIYNKNAEPLEFKWERPNVTIESLENTGREGGTYLHYMITYYENLPGRVTFSQGNPFDHSPDFLDILCHATMKGYQGLSLWYIRGIIPPEHVTRRHLPTQGIRCCDYKIDNTLHMVEWALDPGIRACVQGYKLENRMHPRDPVIPHFLRRAGLERFIRPEYMFSISALFSCDGKQIHNLSKNEWVRLREVLTERNLNAGREGYLLERCWRNFLTT